MIRASAILAACAALAGCELPPLKILYQLSDQTCGTPFCEGVPMECEAVLNIRVLSPDDPSAPYMSICEPVPRTDRRDLCPIASVELDAVALPRETLEVQVMVWPRELVPLDPLTGELDCRGGEVAFDATHGFPISQERMPALGGRAFYHPGDEVTLVTLGCTDLPALNTATCIGSHTVAVTATVQDFDALGVTVGANVANRLTVDIGEPRENAAGPVVEHELNPGDVVRLEYNDSSPTAWTNDIDYEFERHACLVVLESDPQATASVTCEPATAASTMIDISGVRLAKATLQQLLTALQLPAFPDEGLTLGIVLDALGNPAVGTVVLAGEGTVRYLSADRTTFGGTMTTASGIFVSHDAPFGTEFGAFNTSTAVGGRIAGKVTVVVMQRLPIGG